MTHLLSPGSGSLEDLNEYLCNLSADADQFTEESRAAYVDLQNKVEANTNTINNYEKDILELNQQEQDLNQQLNTISDSVECGATGKNETNVLPLYCFFRYIPTSMLVQWSLAEWKMLSDLISNLCFLENTNLNYQLLLVIL